jgi:hypothetical protein
MLIPKFKITKLWIGKFGGLYHYTKNGFHDYNNLRLLSNYSHVICGLQLLSFFKVQPLLHDINMTINYNYTISSHVEHS